jgi:hypothetical protein
MRHPGPKGIADQWEPGSTRGKGIVARTPQPIESRSRSQPSGNRVDRAALVPVLSVSDLPRIQTTKGADDGALSNS